MTEPTYRKNKDGYLEVTKPRPPEITIRKLEEINADLAHAELQITKWETAKTEYTKEKAEATKLGAEVKTVIEK